MKFPKSCYASSQPYGPDWYDNEKEVNRAKLDDGTVITEYLAGRVGTVFGGRIDWTIAPKVRINKTAPKVVAKKALKKKAKKV